MAEREQALESKKISRRKFIFGGAGLAAAAGTGLLIGHEVDKLKSAIETKNGIFYPLYENHLTGIENHHIPSDIDFLLPEVPYNLSEVHPNAVIALGPLPDEQLVKLARQQTELIFADVTTPYAPYYDQIVIGAEMLSTYFLFGVLNTKANKIAGLTRRKLLKMTASLPLVWSFSFLPIAFLPGIATFQDNMHLRRIGARISSLSQDFHPEFLIGTLRSLVMADKMLEVAKNFKESTGRKAKIAFNVGATHANIEDFLELGQDFCRNSILVFPRIILDKIIDDNGGPVNFCTARILKLPQDMSLDYYLSDLDIKETKVVDEKLLRSIK